MFGTRTTKNTRTNRYGQLQFIGMAVGGFVFLMGSIYLGIMKKNAIPTDLIQAVQFAQSGVSARKDGTVNVHFRRYWWFGEY